MYNDYTTKVTRIGDRHPQRTAALKVIGKAIVISAIGVMTILSIANYCITQAEAKFKTKQQIHDAMVESFAYQNKQLHN